MLNQLESASIAGARASDVLGALCHRAVITVLGASDCLAAIEAVLRRLTSASQAEKATMQTLAGNIVSVMGEVATAEQELSQADPTWRVSFVRGVERLVVAGYGTSTIYKALSDLVKDPRQ